MNYFHNHLDKCEQCMEHPFALCPLGNVLLRATAQPGKVPLWVRHDSTCSSVSPKRDHECTRPHHEGDVHVAVDPVFGNIMCAWALGAEFEV